MDWQVWISIAVALAIIEGLTLGLTTIWFAFGSLVAAFCAVIGVPAVYQVLICLVVSGMLMVLTRPIIKNKLKLGKEKTNIDDLKGKQAEVIVPINFNGTGRVKVNNMDWLAEGKDKNQKFKMGESVIVNDIKGVKLIVDRIK